jgi:hypothetical protein
MNLIATTSSPKFSSFSSIPPLACLLTRGRVSEEGKSEREKRREKLTASAEQKDETN